MTSSVSFTCQSGAGFNLTYNWLFNDDVITSSNIEINDSQLIVSNVTHLLGGTYTCVVINQAGVGMNSGDLFSELHTYVQASIRHSCMFYFSFLVNPIITTHPISQLSKFGDIVNFTCAAVSFPSPSYNWSTPIVNKSYNTSTINFSVNYNYFGNYTCITSSSRSGPNVVSNMALLTGNLWCSVLPQCIQNCTYTMSL